MLDNVADADAVSSLCLPILFKAVRLDAGTTRILDGVDLVLSAGEPTVLMGPNGSGKSSLLRLAMGLVRPSAGHISFAGRASPPAGTRAIVFQKPVMLRRTAAANVHFALRAAGSPASAERVTELLELARIAPLADRPARRLSSGEQQRLALARAMARRPDVLFLDEPTASLDPAATRMVEEIVTAVAERGIKVVMSTHDIGQARRIAGDIVFMAGGRIVETAPAARFFSSPATEAARRFLSGDLVL